MAGSGHVETYRDEAGEYRWRAVAGNGATIADSAEGYTERNDAAEGFQRVVEMVCGVPMSLVDVEIRDGEDRST